MKSKIRKGCVLAAGMMVLAGCAGTSVKHEMGRSKVVETSAAAKPEWITNNKYEKDSVMYFSGFVTDVADSALGMRQAKMEAIKNIVEAVKSDASGAFKESLRGANKDVNDLGSFVEDAFALMSEAQISGIMPSQIYFEKSEVVTGGGVKYSYNCYSQVQLPIKDYERAQMLAFQSLEGKAKKENNKAAETAAQDQMEKLEAKLKSRANQ